MLLTWVNPPHRLAVGREQQDGAVVDDDLDSALVVLDAKVVVLNGVARVQIAIRAANVEVVVGEEGEHVLGEVSRLDGDCGEPCHLPKALYELGAVDHPLDSHYHPDSPFFGGTNLGRCPCTPGAP